MQYVPQGAFGMGAIFAWVSEDYERPRHVVYLDAFWLDQTEVTNAEYALCVAASKCQPPARGASNTRPTYYSDPAYAAFPVIGVSANAAANYCAWAGKRLPYEAEWEKAAAGLDNRVYPWGLSDPTCLLANAGGCQEDTSTVGSYPAGASPYGVLDMAGNVREWVRDFFSLDYYQYSPEDNPQGPLTGSAIVTRGGSFADPFTRLLIYNRDHEKPTVTRDDLGFRCAATAKE
jgi:formylglycine-generating enzyme required for sulfatase activity